MRDLWEALGRNTQERLTTTTVLVAVILMWAVIVAAYLGLI